MYYKANTSLEFVVNPVDSVRYRLTGLFRENFKSVRSGDTGSAYSVKTSSLLDLGILPRGLFREKTSSLCCLGIQPRGLFRENLKSVLSRDTASWTIP